MIIRESTLRRLIRHLLIEVCEWPDGPDERSPEEDEAEVRDIFDMLKDEYRASLTDPKLKAMLGRTTLVVIHGPDDPEYNKATRYLGDAASALFRSLEIRHPLESRDVRIRKLAHQLGEHNTVYYHLYSPTDELACLDPDFAEATLRHELEHFVDKMNLFTDERVVRSEDQAALISRILSPSMWTGSGVPQNPPSSFKKKWDEKGGYALWTGAVSMTEEEDQAAMKRFWEEIVVGQMTDAAEAYAVLMTAKRFLDGIGESITSLTRMDLDEIADLSPTGEIHAYHLLAVALMAKDCSDGSECSEAWKKMS